LGKIGKNYNVLIFIIKQYKYDRPKLKLLFFLYFVILQFVLLKVLGGQSAFSLPDFKSKDRKSRYELFSFLPAA